MERREGGTFSDMVWRGERAGLSVTWFQRREGSGTQLQRLLDGGGGRVFRVVFEARRGAGISIHEVGRLLKDGR